jgi:hypothetical protein
VEKEGALAQSQEYIHTGYHSEKYANILHQRRCENLSFFSYTDDWHTEFRIQYFANSNHCIHIYEMLEGEEKRQAAESRLDEFEADMQDPDVMSIEDYSTAGLVDEPPIDSHLYCATLDDES